MNWVSCCCLIVTWCRSWGAHGGQELAAFLPNHPPWYCQRDTSKRSEVAVSCVCELAWYTCIPKYLDLYIWLVFSGLCIVVQLYLPSHWTCLFIAMMYRYCALSLLEFYCCHSLLDQRGRWAQHFIAASLYTSYLLFLLAPLHLLHLLYLTCSLDTDKCSFLLHGHVF